MAQATLEVKNGAVKLPKAWRGAKVFIRETGDTIVIKKVQRAAFWDTWAQLAPLGRKVKGRDITAAVRWARRHR